MNHTAFQLPSSTTLTNDNNININNNQTQMRTLPLATLSPDTQNDEVQACFNAWERNIKNMQHNNTKLQPTVSSSAAHPVQLVNRNSSALSTPAAANSKHEIIVIDDDDDDDDDESSDDTNYSPRSDDMNTVPIQSLLHQTPDVPPTQMSETEMPTTTDQQSILQLSPQYQKHSSLTNALPSTAKPPLFTSTDPDALCLPTTLPPPPRVPIFDDEVIDVDDDDIMQKLTAAHTIPYRQTAVTAKDPLRMLGPFGDGRFVDAGGSLYTVNSANGNIEIGDSDDDSTLPFATQNPFPASATPSDPQISSASTIPVWQLDASPDGLKEENSFGDDIVMTENNNNPPDFPLFPIPPPPPPRQQPTLVQGFPIPMPPASGEAAKEQVQFSSSSELYSKEKLQDLVKKNSLTADATEEAATPPQLNVKLMPHQRRALAWMAKRERPDVEVAERDLISTDEECRGGILADEQGLGKTLSMIALMLKNPPTAPPGVKRSNELEKDAKKGARRTPWRTVIVCPVSLVTQWREEVETRMRADHVPSVYIYHGAKRARSVQELQSYDVVITTYATLTTEYPKILKTHPLYEARRKAKMPVPRRDPGPLFKCSWHRVILDEAHYIKNRRTDSWAATAALSAEHRWCLTGTPIQNSVDDIYSLFMFLRYHFVPSYEVWNMQWKRKLEHNNAAVRERAFKRFQTIVGLVLLRRTKQDTIDGKPLIVLPKRVSDVLEQEFDDNDEKAVYKAVQEKSVVAVNKFLVAGTLAHNYSSVLLLLLRLRQACCHPFLIEYAHIVGQKGRGSSPDKLGFRSSYSDEELDEAMELVNAGHSLLELVDENAREQTVKLLKPAPGNLPEPQAFTCMYCVSQVAWDKGVALQCGHFFCPACTNSIMQSRTCRRCQQRVQGDETEAFITLDNLRQEVHAKERAAVIEQNRETEGSHTSQSLKALLRSEVEKRVGRPTKRPRCGTSSVKENLCSNGISSCENADALMPQDMKGDSGSDSSSLDNGRSPSPDDRLVQALSQRSTKLRVLLEQLREVRSQGKNEKTLVFSQWTTMLDIIEFHVQLDGHDTCRLDGSMPMAVRKQQIEQFKNDKRKTVFLISLHAGGTGLNLCVANHVILCDVWWNPQTEEQAIDRVHRIGQSRDVRVCRFKMSNTVEDRIYDICARKRELSDGALGVTGAQSLGRKKLTLEEIMFLFSGAAEDVAHDSGANEEATRAARNILNYASFS